MFESWRLSHVLRAVGAAAVVLFLVVHVGGAARPRLDRLYNSAPADERAVFVDAVLAHEVDGPVNGSALQALCAAQTWTPGLLLTCDAVPGELGDVRSGVLNCLRIAMAMGAEVVLPQIVLRSTIDLAVVAPMDVGPRRGVPLGHFFDADHLNRSLAAHCPQLAVHASLDAFAADPRAQVATRLDVFRVPNVTLAANMRGSSGRLLKEPAKLGAAIHAFLDGVSPPARRAYPFHVNLRPTPTYLFPVAAAADAADAAADADAAALEDPALARQFGRLLRVRRDLRQLAANVLFNLRRAFQLEGALPVPADGTSAPPASPPSPPSFIGVELRTQRDPQQDRLPPYAVQASDALSFVAAHNATLAYLTEGATRANATAFAERCGDFGVTVVDKDALVDGAERAVLSRLSYDERFLVDYEVVLRAGLFTGQAMSSFAWNVALRRHNAWAAEGGEAAGEDADAPHLEGTIRWRDAYSTLYGERGVGDEMRRGIWP